MRPPDHYSVSPLPSIATRFPPGSCDPGAGRPVSISEMLRQIFAWLRGEHLTLRQRILEQKRIDRLAAELEAEDEIATASSPSRQGMPETSPATPKKGRRKQGGKGQGGKTAQ